MQFRHESEATDAWYKHKEVDDIHRDTDYANILEYEEENVAQVYRAQVWNDGGSDEGFDEPLVGAAEESDDELVEVEDNAEDGVGQVKGRVFWDEAKSTTVPTQRDRYQYKS